MSEHLYCEVIIPLAVKGTFTYRIPEENTSIQPGVRVEVQFGKRKHYTGIVRSIHQQAPQGYIAKNILDIVDEKPVVTEYQLAFWEWIAQYYCCNIGEVMLAAMPAYFRPDSETLYIRYPDSEVDILDLPDDEYLVASALEHQDALSLSNIHIILQKKSVQKVIKNLINKRVIVLKEFIDEKFKPKVQVFTKLSSKYIEDKSELQQLFKILEKKPKQSDLLLSYLTHCPKGEWLTRTELLKKSGISGATHRTMVDKGIFEIEEKTVSRILDENILERQHLLNEAQVQAVQQINEQWNDKNVVLLRGVTASGKTHVYVELIREAIAKGQQVLYLVPEIALTSQLIRRLEDMLGKVGVYHSKYNPSERVETWNKVINQEYRIVVGARSAMFLPFQNLGLIVVDEEHDGSYKQNDPAPRYQARDSIIYLAHLVKSKVILGSATPSIESWVNAQSGRFGYVEMLQRHGEMSLPVLDFVDMTQARKNKQVTGMVSNELQNAIHQTIQKGKQVIIFQNRRGYSPYISCKDCSWTPECPHCDVHLTFHKYSEQLKCHYCGYTMRMPRECPPCSSTLLEMRGAGTERVEDDLQALFPQAKLLRLDYDTAKNKNSHERIIEQFENGEADILVGTQMVTKGLDFKNVELVGVLNADALLFYPDFRAIERAFQLLSQVSGRAGRSEDLGKVLIQISQPQHKITSYLKENDILSFYKDEISEREKFHYPPFVRMIHLSIRDQNEKVAHEAAVFLFQQLKNLIPGDCLGPSTPSISRVQGKYIREILIKVPRNSQHVNVAKSSIESARQLMYQYKIYNKVRVNIDVDP